MSNVKIIVGPPTSKVAKADAEAKLVAHPQFPKEADFTLEEVEGRWIAAIAPKVAEGNPFADNAAEPAGPPAADGPAEGEASPDGPPSDDAPSDDAEGEDKPKGDEKGDKGGEKGEIAHLTQLVTLLVQALGLDPSGANPVPGADDPHGGPPSEEGGPHEGPPGPGADEKTHTVHERALKPGEAPPGSTPVGAPAFASVADDHPWKDVLGKKRTFKLEEPIGDQRMAEVRAELVSLAEGTGYEVKQLVEGRNEAGQRTAKALISR